MLWGEAHLLRAIYERNKHRHKSDLPCRVSIEHFHPAPVIQSVGPQTGLLPELPQGRLDRRFSLLDGPMNGFP